MRTMERPSAKKPRLLYLILMISFPSVATVLISPALPAMAHYFHISNSYAQQLITLFVVGYAAGQLIYSPFANRYGRKIAIYLGLGLYLFSCLLCLFGIYQHSINTILIGRLLMALGSSVGMVISFTIINDYYQPHEARSIVSFTVLSYSFMPAVAIALGGFITTHLSWIDCFYFYLFYGVLILIIGQRLPETLKQADYNALKLQTLMRSFSEAFGARRLVFYSIVYGLMASYIYLITSGAPFIGINDIHLSSATYGLLLLIPYSGQFIGAFCAGYLAKRFSSNAMIYVSFGLTSFGSVVMLLSFAFGSLNIYTLMAPMFFIMMGIAMAYGNLAVLAQENFEDKATGSAVMSFVVMSISLFATLLYSILPNHKPTLLPSLFVAITLLAIIIFAYTKKRFSGAL